MLPYPVDHIGIAVLDLDAALSLYTKDLGLTLTLRETVETQHVEVAFVEGPGTCIELLAPSSPQSTLSTFLQKRGPGLHHIAFKVYDIRAELARLKSLGAKLIDEVPRSGARESLIAFIHPSFAGGVLIELRESQSKSL